jgi:hypothetical protein
MNILGADDHVSATLERRRRGFQGNRARKERQCPALCCGHTREEDVGESASLRRCDVHLPVGGEDHRLHLVERDDTRERLPLEELE